MRIRFTCKFFTIISFFLNLTALSAQSTISTFDTDDDGWRVSGDATNSIPQYFSSGGNTGGYISATDAVTSGVWYWSAPAKFLGNKSMCFGGIFKYDLKQSGLNNQFNSLDVIIIGSGDTIVCVAGNPLTTWTHYDIPLNSTFAWKINASTGALATDAYIQNVLTNITNLRIRGEYISGSDRGDLDNVAFPCETLPISLLSFTATSQKEDALLAWSTSSEINTSYFEIQNAIDGSIFKTIGKVAANVNTTSQKTYTFRHVSPSTGRNFYRLKIVDKDGTSSYSTILKLTENGDGYLKIFPNPTSGVFTISGIQANQNNFLQLLDKTGRTLKMQKITANSFSIDISQYPPGIYIVRIQSNSYLREYKISKL